MDDVRRINVVVRMDDYARITVIKKRPRSIKLLGLFCYSKRVFDIS